MACKYAAVTFTHPTGPLQFSPKVSLLVLVLSSFAGDTNLFRRCAKLLYITDSRTLFFWWHAQTNFSPGISYLLKNANNWKHSMTRMLIDQIFIIERNIIFYNNRERKRVKKRKKERLLYALCNKLIIMWRYTDGYISHLCHEIN